MTQTDPLTGATREVATRARLVAGAIALLAALVGAWIAPEPWATGEAELVVSHPTGTATFPVFVGSTEPVGGGLAGVAVAAPDGVPTDGLVRVVVTGEGLGLGNVEVALRWPDGTRELVPVVREVDDTGVEAERRPPRRAAVVVGLLAFAAVLWVAGTVPIHLPSLAVPVVLAAGGVATPTAALAPFAHPIIILFFAGFLMAVAMQRVGLDRWVATEVVARASRGPGQLYLAALGLSAFLSMWMSNTAAVAVLIPVALAIARPLQSRSYERALVLGLAWAATIGGVGSAIGTPANPLAMDFLRRVAGREVTFAGWFAFGLPMVVLFVPVIAAWVWWRSDVEVDRERFDAARRIALEGREGSLDREQRVVLSVFGAVVLVWLTQTWHGFDTGLVALTGAIVLFAIGRLETEDLGRISWSSLLTFGGGLSLGLHLTSTGVADWVATRLASIGALPAPLGLLVVAGVVLLLTTLASNTATAAVMVPLAIPLATLIGVDPVVLVVVVAIASSIDFALVIGTPPTMLAHATGMFSTQEIFRKGILLDLLGLLVLVLLVVPLWGLFGVT